VNEKEKSSIGKSWEGPYVFRSYQLSIDETTPEYDQPRNQNADNNIKLWKVGGATAALSSLFPPQVIRNREYYHDHFLQNPVEWALEEVHSIQRKMPTTVSFGAGKPAQSDGRRVPKLKRSTELINEVLKTTTAGLVHSEREHKVVDKMQRREKNMTYFRINVEDDLGEVEVDQWKGFRRGVEFSTLGYIWMCTKKELSKQEVKNQLSALAWLLVNRRRARIRDDPDRWERFACCTTYTCSEEECRTESGEPLTFALRREMKDHLLARHGWVEESLESEPKPFTSEGERDFFNPGRVREYSKSEGKRKSYKPEEKGQESSELKEKLDQCRKEPEVPGGPF
jgi:hypothetical protein